jgi:hypothetical protein
MVMAIWCASHAAFDNRSMFEPSNVLLGHKPAAVNKAWFAMTALAAQDTGNPVAMPAMAPKCKTADAWRAGEGFQRDIMM